MILIFNFLSALFGLLLLLSATASSTETMSSDLVQVSNANAQFSNKLYNILSKEKGNIFYSPISAHAVLAMAFQGAAGKTAQEFVSTLNIPDHKLAANGYKDIMNALNNIQNVTLHLANKMFVMQGFPLKAPFSKAITEAFLSEVESVNFGENTAVANTINKWVEDKTNSKIKNLITPNLLNSLTRMVLVNAIYFKGNWAFKFSKEDTEEEPFYVKSDERVKCQMMHINKKFNYMEDENLDAKILELPYNNQDVSMVIILPNAVDGIANLEKKMESVDFAGLTRHMRSVEVDVSLPRFKIETTIDLKDVLQQMGLVSIFESEADFSEISESTVPLYVSKVIQKAFIEVNEEGAEAAAATAVVIMARSMPIRQQKREFRADHPFIIALLHKQSPSASILFVGRISNPSG
ncbi:hypothetical protein ILUMI_11472 [Ignelater luminosus]|uniref:Serpin domain-containing protein n=1 Tax=Ignelater luminosus TaxID=2038154 RepID=A0A8K0D076_IGNLU|nr:hypothetical protein ILUMI_11472 [Ignelater luminosus]